MRRRLLHTVLHATMALSMKALNRLGSNPQVYYAGGLALALGGLLLLKALPNTFDAEASSSLEAERCTFVVTGASQGVGRAVSCLLAKQYPHARLVLVSRRENLLRDLAEELRSTRRALLKGQPGGPVLYYQADCAVASEVTAVCNRLQQETAAAAAAAAAQAAGAEPAAAPPAFSLMRFFGLAGAPAAQGALHVVTCAGVGTWRAIFEDDATAEDTERCLSAPLLSTLHTAHAFLPTMLARGCAGRFVCVQSPASRLAWPGATAYTAARWGLRGLCAALAQDLPSGGPVSVCEVILSEVTDSAYFSANPGSRERLPSIAPLFGRLTSEAAAHSVVDAMRRGTREYIAPIQLFLGLSTLWVPGVEGVFSWLVRVTGWKVSRR